MPKPNFYQSLHTTVIGEAAQPFEIQIRTREMDLIAERGIAAHWKYKEGSSARTPTTSVSSGCVSSSTGRARSPIPASSSRRSRSTSTPTRSTRSRRRARSSRSRAERPGSTSPTASTRTSATAASARGSTEARSAPHAARERGHRRDPDGAEPVPSRDWLSFVATSRARHKIRHFIQSQEKARAVELGRRLLERELKKYRKTIKKLESEGKLQAELPSWGFSRAEDLYAALGYGKLAARNALERLIPADELDRPEPARPRPRSRASSGRSFLSARRTSPSSATTTSSSLAKCCNPVPGEKIVGYITRGRGVSFRQLPERAQPPLRPGAADRRRVGRRKGGDYAIELDVVTDDRPELLADLTQAIAGEGSNIRRIEARSRRTGRATSRSRSRRPT